MNWLTPANTHVVNKGKDVHINVVGKKLPFASIKFMVKVNLISSRIVMV